MSGGSTESWKPDPLNKHAQCCGRMTSGAWAEPPTDADPICSPSHYQLTSTLQVLEVLEAANLPNHLNTALAYLLRCPKKGQYQDDLKKCAFYVLRQLALNGVDVLEFVKTVLEKWPQVK